MPAPTDVLLARTRSALTTLRYMLQAGTTGANAAVIDGQLDTIESLLGQIQEGG